MKKNNVHSDLNIIAHRVHVLQKQRDEILYKHKKTQKQSGGGRRLKHKTNKLKIGKLEKSWNDIKKYYNV